jgi:hypothetical protein
MKDMTPAQARHWVDQEFAKVSKANAASRIASEEMVLSFTELADQLPNSTLAHRLLLARIRKEFGQK